MNITVIMRRLFYSLILLLPGLVYGCGLSTADQEATGTTVLFSLGKSAYKTEQVTCDEVDTITISVYKGVVSIYEHESGKPAGNQPSLISTFRFDCLEHQGAMDNIPVGATTFVIEGYDAAGNTIYLGNPVVVTIEGDKSMDIGTVVLNQFKSIGVGNLLSLPVAPFATDGIEADFSSFESMPEGLKPPDGASFDIGSQVFNWTPACNQTGLHKFRFKINDENGDMAAYKILFVKVLENSDNNCLNNPPEIVSPLKNDYRIAVSFLFTLNVIAEDPDGDNLNLSADNLPEGASLIPVNSDPGKATGTFNWTPGSEDIGRYENICFRATELGEQQLPATRCITVNVVL